MKPSNQDFDALAEQAGVVKAHTDNMRNAMANATDKDKQYLKALVEQADELHAHIEKLRQQAEKLDAFIELYRMQCALENTEKA